MKKVKVSVATSISQYPAEVVSAGITITLGAAKVVLTSAPYVAVFENVEVGVYEITAVAKDADGNVLGFPVYGSITIDPEVVNIDIPASLIVEVI